MNVAEKKKKKRNETEEQFWERLMETRLALTPKGRQSTTVMVRNPAPLLPPSLPPSVISFLPSIPPSLSVALLEV
jgi:hypothetical protein